VMLSSMNLLILFLVGILVGLAIGVLIYETHYRKLKLKLVDRFAGQAEELASNMRILGAFTAYMERCEEITHEQQRLLSLLGGPTRSATHSKYKKSIYKEINDLEEKKMVIFKKVNDMGYDPEVSFKEDGKITKKRISAVLMKREFLKSAKIPKTKTDLKNIQDRHLKIVKDIHHDTSPDQVR